MRRRSVARSAGVTLAARVTVIDSTVMAAGDEGDFRDLVDHDNHNETIWSGTAAITFFIQDDEHFAVVQRRLGEVLAPTATTVRSSESACASTQGAESSRGQ